MPSKKSEIEFATPVTPTPPAPDFDADVDAAIAFVRKLADDAAKAAAALVRHERDRSWVHHGEMYVKDGYPDRQDRAPNDPALLAMLRRFSTACGEFVHVVKGCR
jgi:hypothetical protein